MRRSLAALLGLLLLTAALVAADLFAPTQDDDGPLAAAVAGPVASGGWYCGALASAADDTTEIVTAAPRADLEPPSQTTYAELLGGSRTSILEDNVFPESVLTRDVSPDVTSGGVEVRWDQYPVVVSRVWRARPETGPRGVVAGACATGPQQRWYLPGLSTAGGADAVVHVVNPFAEAASIAVTFLTPEGEVDPVRLRNQVVPPNGTLALDVKDFLPRQGDLAVEVTARSGRVLVEAVQRVDAAIGGINGVSLARAVHAPQTAWTVPWVVVGEVDVAPQPPVPTPTETQTTESPTDEATASPTQTPTATQTPTPTATATESQTPTATPVPSTDLPVVDGGPLSGSPGTPATSWVWIANPGDDPAPVTLTLHASSGPVVPELGEELSVPARGVRRVALDGLLPPGENTAGVTVTAVDDSPIVVSVGTVVRLAEDDPDRTGYSVQLGESRPDVSWVMTGPASPDGTFALHLVNPSAELAVVDVVLWDGAAGQRPPALQGMEVGAGSFLEVSLEAELLQGRSYSAFVTTRQGSVVAGSRSVGPSVPVDWSVTTGVPSAVWRGGGVVPVIRQREGLVEELD